MEKILISACLVGENTRYDGKNNYLPIVEKLKERYDLIPFCPEMAGGLSVPREPCEIKGIDIVTKEGVSKSKEYNLGAKKALEACKLFGIRIAILMESSPSCGVRNIHDGHFNTTKIPGKGITTRLLEENGIHCYSSYDDLTFLIREDSKEGKEYLSYEDRVAYLKERSRFSKNKAFGRKPFKAKTTSEKPAVDEEKKTIEGENAAPKKEFKRSFKNGSSFHHHDGKGRNFSHKDGESRPFKKDGFKKHDGKRPFKKDDDEKKFHDGKKSYGEKKTFSGKKPYRGKTAYGKGAKRFSSKGNFHKTNKKSA